jgi:hypothetical protein
VSRGDSGRRSSADGWNRFDPPSERNMGGGSRSMDQGQFSGRYQRQSESPRQIQISPPMIRERSSAPAMRAPSGGGMSGAPRYSGGGGGGGVRSSGGGSHSGGGGGSRGGGRTR